MSRKSQSTKERSSRVVRKTAGDDPPPIPKPLPPGSVPRSPLSQEVELQAQKLIHEAGSKDAAKSAVEVAADRERIPDFQEDHFAQRWGFASRAEMRAASKPISADDGNTWWATRLANDRWIVWNKDDLTAKSTFASLDEVRHVMDSGRA
jgi:hypothetical protein